MDSSVSHGHLKEQGRFCSVLKGFVSFKRIITLRKSPYFNYYKSYQVASRKTQMSSSFTTVHHILKFLPSSVDSCFGDSVLRVRLVSE